MPRDPDCIFCKIVVNEIPSQIVFENDALISFMDIGPLAEGHILVIPRDHYEKLSDVPASIASAVAGVLPGLGRALLQVTKADGYNVLLNEGRVAGQAVPHAHFHLIPRKAGDGLGYRWNAGKYAAGREAQIAAAYKGAVASHLNKQ